MTDENPFRPGFGKQPPVMAGRDDFTARFWRALEAGPRDLDYAMVLTGIRGCGKTALMGAMRDQAHRKGWGVIKVTATGDERLEAAICERAPRPDAKARRFPRMAIGRARTSRAGRAGRRATRRLRGVQAAGFGAEWESPSQTALSEILRRLGERAARKGRGVLLTVDEMHKATDMEIRRLAVCLQEVVGEEGWPVAFLGAGLTELAEKIDDKDGMTFFQRCGRAPLALLNADEARQALGDPIRQSGKSIEANALDEAVQSAMGYPFKLQLIGYHAWDGSGEGEGITQGVVRGASYVANRIMLTQIILPIWTHMDRDQQRVLVAMSEDDDASRTDDIASRAGIPDDEVRAHFKRMEVVGATERLSMDECRFMHPLMRQWVRGEETPTAQQAIGMHLSLAPDGRGRSLEQPPPPGGLKEKILAAHAASPKASNAELARRVKASRSYVGKVLKSHKKR